MHSDNFNYTNNTFNNLPSFYRHNFSMNLPSQDYTTLNSIHINNSFYNNKENQTHSEIIKMKTYDLINELKTVIDFPDATLDFQLIHMKCFRLNQFRYQVEFYEVLQNVLIKKIENYKDQLLSNINIYGISQNSDIIADNNLNLNKKFDNVKKSRPKNKYFFSNDNFSGMNFNNNIDPNYKISAIENEILSEKKFAKRFLSYLIEIYNKFRKTCEKISEMINVLDLGDYLSGKFELKNMETFRDFETKDKISQINAQNLYFKTLFSLFFQNFCFEDNIRNKTLSSLTLLVKYFRENFKKFTKINNKYDEYINKEILKQDVFTSNNKILMVSEENNTEKIFSSNLKLNENAQDEDKKIENFPITNFASVKKSDPIMKIKGILRKKNLIDNEFYSEKINRDEKDILLDLNSIYGSISTNKKDTKNRVSPLDLIKFIFRICNEMQSLNKFLNHEKLEKFQSSVDEIFLKETKLFYEQFSNKYISYLSEQNKNFLFENPTVSYKNQKEKEKEKFSYYDITLLNYKSDNDQNFNNSFSENNNKIDDSLKISNDNNCSDNWKKIKYDHINYNTNSAIHPHLDEFDEKNYKISNTFLNKKKQKNILHENSTMKKKISPKNLPIGIESFVIEFSKFLDLEENLMEDYKKKQEIVNMILKIVLQDNENFLSDKGLRIFIEKFDYEIIKFLFDLYSKTEEMKTNFNKLLNLNINLFLTNMEKNHIIVNKHKGIEYVNFCFFVEEIFETKRKFYKLLTQSLNHYSRSELIIKTNLEKIVNKNVDFLENFVKLAHDEIKIAIKNKDQSRLKDFHEKFLSIYKLFNDKDLFELEYRKYLSKRLLRNSSMVKETEYEFFEILKRESGTIYTRKIEKILNEISLSYDLNQEYLQKYSQTVSRLKSTEEDHSITNKDDNGNIYSNMKLSRNIVEILQNHNNIGKNQIEKSNFNDFKYSNKKDNNFQIQTSLRSGTPISNLDNETNYNTNINTSRKNSNLQKPSLDNNINFSNRNIFFQNSPDINISNFQSNYQTEVIQMNNKKNLIDINVKVVSSDCWLLENVNIKNNKKLNISEIVKTDIKFPEELKFYIQKFTDFYSTKFKNRQLKWIHEFSYSFIDFKLRNKIYTLICSSYQMNILTLFNKRKIYTFGEILEKLEIDSKVNIQLVQKLKSHILPIISQKIILLKKKEKEEIKDILLEESLYLNETYDGNETKIRLLNSIIEKKEILIEEKKETEISHFIIEDRKYQMDSIIMKILKQNKIIQFDKLKNLIQEEINKFFVPEVSFIKLRLDNLMDRNYVKRSDSDVNFYEYI